MTWNKISKLLALAFLSFTLLSLSSCRKVSEPTPTPTDLPIINVEWLDPTQRPYVDRILQITWFKSSLPYHDGHYLVSEGSSLGDYEFNRLTWYSDGSVQHKKIGIQHNYLQALGRLTKEQQEELYVILKTMRESPSAVSLAGSMVIKVSFPWQGESYTSLFSETNCSDELGRLLAIADTAFGQSTNEPDALQNICKIGAQHQEQAQDYVSPDPSLLYPNAFRLFCITWFKQPFIDSYTELCAYTDRSLDYRQYVDSIDQFPGEEGQLTEEEKQKVQAILGGMINEGSLEQPAGTMIIILGFPWEADYHAFTWGDSNCSDDLHHLLEIANTALKRDASSYEDFSIPCQ